MRVVIDTNVLISALLKANSGPSKIIELWRAQILDVVVSPEIIAEVSRVLAYPKISERIPGEVAERFLALLWAAATVIEPNLYVTAVDADPDDDKFVTLALVSNVAFIVSGDRHLLEVGAYQGITIVTPAQFLAIISEMSDSEE